MTSPKQDIDFGRKEEDKMDYAGGGRDMDKGLSERDRKLQEAFHQLHMDPEIGSVEYLQRFMRKYGSLTTRKDISPEEPLSMEQMRYNQQIPLGQG